MKILFKDDTKVYYINNDKLDYAYGTDYDLTNVKHLDDAKILYNYRSGRRSFRCDLLTKKLDYYKKIEYIYNLIDYQLIILVDRLEKLDNVITK